MGFRSRAAAAAVMTVLCLGPGPAGARPENGNRPPALADLTQSVERVAASATPRLVRVIRSTEVPGQRPQRILGTGVSLGGGRVLTCAGVVGPAREVLVTAADGDTLPARVLGVDRRTNVAVIEATGLALPALPAAPNTLLFPGDLVVAVGLGPPSAPTASFGTVVLVQGPSLGYSEVDMVQVTAPVFPGFTGGALLDRQGRIVALLSGKMEIDPAQAMVPAGTDMVAGFVHDGGLTTTVPTAATVALPIGHALETAEELIRLGYVERGFLGVQVELTNAVRAGGGSLRGVIVHRVVDGSPAATAGILPGDVILDYASARVQSPEDLSFLVAATVPGAEVPIRYLRRGMRVLAQVTVQQAPDLDWTPDMDLSLIARPDTGLAPAVR